MLSRSRGFTSNGVSLPLTFEAVDGYARRYDFNEDFDDFYRIISGVDESYLKLEAKRRAAEKRRADSKRKKNERKSH